jgi:hypothetical protein
MKNPRRKNLARIPGQPNIMPAQIESDAGLHWKPLSKWQNAVIGA